MLTRSRKLQTYNGMITGRIFQSIFQSNFFSASKSTSKESDRVSVSAMTSTFDSACKLVSDIMEGLGDLIQTAGWVREKGAKLYRLRGNSQLFMRRAGRRRVYRVILATLYRFLALHGLPWSYCGGRVVILDEAFEGLEAKSHE